MFFTYFTYNITMFVAVISAYLLQFDSNCNKFIKLFLTGITFFSLFIVSAVRYQVGADFENYVIMYNNADYYYDYMEVGFRFFVYFFKWIGFNSQSMFVFTAFLNILFVVLAGNKLKRLDLVVFMYICNSYLNSLNAIRQELATAIILYALVCLYYKETKKFLILIFFATMFHSVSLFMTPFIFFNKVKFNRYTILLSFIIIYFVSTISIADLLKSTNFLEGSRYNFYLNSSIYNKTTTVNLINEFCRLFVLIPAFLIPKSQYHKDNWDFCNFVMILNIAFVIMYTISLQFYIFHRFVSLFSVALILSIVLISKSNLAFKKLLVILTMVVSLLYFENDIRVSQKGFPGKQISPYQTMLFWDK